MNWRQIVVDRQIYTTWQNGHMEPKQRYQALSESIRLQKTMKVARQEFVSMKKPIFLSNGVTTRYE